MKSGAMKAAMEGIGTRQMIHHHLVQMVTIPKGRKPGSKNTMATGVDTIPKSVMLMAMAMSITTLPEAPTGIGAQGGIMKSEPPPWLQGTTMPEGNPALQGPGVIAMMT